MIAQVWRQVYASSRSLTGSRDVGLRRVATRLALQTVGLVLVMLIVLEVVVYVITRQALIGSLETTLQQRSNPPADYVRGLFHLGNVPPDQYRPDGAPGGNRFGPGPNPDLNASDASRVFIEPPLHVLHGDGALGVALLDAPGARQAMASGQIQCCSVHQYQGQNYLVYTNPLVFQGRVVGAVQSSISEHQYEETMNTLFETLLVVALLGLVGSGGVSIVLVQRALRPIRVAIQRQRDFVADAAHELRTPLAIQRTLGEVGLNDSSAENSETTVEQMLVENRHLTRLVDDLSLLARADSHVVSISPAPMNLSSLVEDTTAELEPLAEERGMRLAVDVRANVWVSGDIMRLRQLLLVLIDNAVKYTPSGGRIEVRLHAGGGRAHLQVRDSGPGIEPADLPRIFDRFYRADKARTGEGSGLGLAIAKWIVEAHGGHIQASNVAPHGALLSALLPIARVAASS
ncbi:MAG: hypothetical protein NVS4B2_21670 [Chloroflexota bacterium]